MNKDKSYYYQPLEIKSISDIEDAESVEDVESVEDAKGAESVKDVEDAKGAGNDIELIDIQDLQSVQEKINELTIQQQSKLQNLEPYIYRVIPNCTREHLEYCDCQKELYINFRKQEKIRIANELKKDNKFIDDPGIARERLKEAGRFALERVVKYCEKHDLKCTYHTEQLKHIYSLFSKKYDMKDPKVVISLTVLMSNLSSLIKTQSFSNKKGIIQKEYDRDGNEILNTYMNEKLKIEVNNAIMKTMKTLDEVIEGHKNVNLNINANEIRPIHEIFGDK